MLGLVFLSAIIKCSWAKTVTYDWRIGWKLLAPDGFLMPVITINGLWPPPTIEADVNDTIVVNAYNELGNETASIHFHGQFQAGSAGSDGAVGIGQCGILPGGSFQYKFKAYPPGTHWWHSHAQAQYPDGLRGKMIIHDPEWEKSLQVDEQIYLSVSDWWHQQSPFMVRDYLSVNNTNTHIPLPDAFLMNDSREPLNFTLQHDKRYLLRIVSFAGLVCGHFRIANQTLTVVAIDGHAVCPTVTDTIAICAGQSYDVIVVGDSDWNKTNYIFKVGAYILNKETPPDGAMALIGDVNFETQDRASGSTSDSGPYQPRGLSFTSSPPDFINMAEEGILDDATLVPLDEEPLYEKGDRRINLRINQVYYEGIGIRSGIGIQPWVQPKVPTLLSAFTTGKYALDWKTYGPGVSPYVVRHNQIVEIYMENPQKWPHPMHLHGHYFQIAGRGLGSWDGKEESLYKTPAKRNNVVIPPHGWFLIRFKANNPGVWFFHCHIDLHVVAGMAATIIEAPDVLQLEQSIPFQNMGTCEAKHACSSGNCNCGHEELLGEDAEAQCNTVFNSVNPGKFGALIPWSW